MRGADRRASADVMGRTAMSARMRRGGLAARGRGKALVMTTPSRSRLPNRRRSETRELTIGNLTLTATVGFDEAGRPAEVFLCGAKDGSGLAAILDDASVMVSIALQHGIRA